MVEGKVEWRKNRAAQTAFKIALTDRNDDDLDFYVSILAVYKAKKVIKVKTARPKCKAKVFCITPQNSLEAIYTFA